MKLKRILFVLLFATIIHINVSAKSGCCSHHGGVLYYNATIVKVYL